MKNKIINLQIHDGNYNRRVKYNDKNEFDLLIINFQDGVKIRTFQVESKYLPETDSIHLKYNPENHEIKWSPRIIISHIVELY